MFHRLRTCRSARLGLLALAALLAAPAASRAETLYFRNDTPVALVVQGSSIVQGQVKIDRPNLLKPGDKCAVTLPGIKVIVTKDAKPPNPVVNKATLAPTLVDAYYSIQTDPRLPGLVKLVATQPFKVP